MAVAMDLHALSHRELQALCKHNGVCANMTNVSMDEALQSLTSVSSSLDSPVRFIVLDDLVWDSHARS